MAINQNSAFVRVFFDLPTPVAVEFDALVKGTGKPKRQVISEIVQAYVAQHSTTKVTKGKK